MMQYGCLCHACVVAGQSCGAQEDEEQRKDEAARRSDCQVEECQQEAKLSVITTHTHACVHELRPRKEKLEKSIVPRIPRQAAG
jgi:tellurite resistance protein